MFAQSCFVIQAGRGLRLTLEIDRTNVRAERHARYNYTKPRANSCPLTTGPKRIDA